MNSMLELFSAFSVLSIKNEVAATIRPYASINYDKHLILSKSEGNVKEK